RAVVAEMHAGYMALRNECAMNMWRPVLPRELTPAATANVRRIEAIWTDCRTRFGARGAFLFSSFGAADAMFAPVVSRFHTYAVPVGAVARAYTDAVMGLPAWQGGCPAARQAPRARGQDDDDW